MSPLLMAYIYHVYMHSILSKASTAVLILNIFLIDAHLIVCVKFCMDIQ